jgi:hypothetical protein
MKILALDIATRTGWAIGLAGEMPRSGAVTIRKPHDPLRTAAFKLATFIRDMHKLEGGLDLVVYEQPLDPRVKFETERPQNGEALVLPWIIMGGVGTICGFYEIRAEEANRQTTLKHFTGKARHGSRAAAKDAVLKRCHLLGYLPRDCKDDDRGDACALHDFASARYGRVRPKALHLFGEQAVAS